MRSVLEKICRENQNIPIFNNFSKNRAVYEIIWKNMVQPDRPQMTIWRMGLARSITRAIDTHSEWVIFLFHGNNF